MSLYELLKSMTMPQYIVFGVDLLLILFCLIGLILAIMRWKKHRAVSIITIFSMILIAVSLIGSYSLWIYFSNIQPSINWGGKWADFNLAEKYEKLAESREIALAFLMLLISIVQLIILPLFLTGIFIGRGKTEKFESNSM